MEELRNATQISQEPITEVAKAVTAVEDVGIQVD